MTIVVEGTRKAEPEEHERPIGFKERFVNFHWNKFAKDLFPFTNWLFHYKTEDLPYDIIAGITVGLTLVPQCLSYAAICNVRSEFGLYTSFFGQFIYFIFGTSKDGSVGPTAITSMMMGMVNGMFNPLASEGDNTYNALITFISGLILIGIGLLKLGFIVNLFSIPVVSGFTSAAGFVILGSQVKLFFGLQKAPNDSPGSFVKQMKNIYDRRDEIRPYDVLCGCLVMIVLFMFQYTPVLIAKIKEVRAKGKPVPPPGPVEARVMQIVNILVASRNVIVFVISTGVAYHFYLQADDPKAFEKKFSLVGHIKPGLPTWQFPATEVVTNRLKLITPEEAMQLQASNVSIISNSTGNFTMKPVVLKTMSEIINDLSAYIIIIPLMTMLELFAITKALGRKNGYSVNPTNELLGVGIANFLQSFINAFPATTTISRCALNDQCKVKTQLASLISATIIIITLVVLTPLFYYIPKPCLAAIMICAGYNLVDINIVIHMWHESPRDVFVLLGAFVLCLFYDIAYGILICILLNMVLFLRPIMAMPLIVSQRPLLMRDGRQSSQMVTIIKIPHGMEYPSCDRFIEEMTLIFVNSDTKNLLVDCQFIYRVDYSGIQAFRSLVMMAFKLKKHLIFSNLSEKMAKKFEKLGIEHFTYVESVDEAVKGHYWASKQDFAADGTMTHISSIVVPRGSSVAQFAPKPSRPRLSVAQSMAKIGMGIPSTVHMSRGDIVIDTSKPGDEDENVPRLRKPITTQELGTSFRHDGGLFSASLASMWIVANLAPTDDKVVQEWKETEIARHKSAKGSMARIATFNTGNNEDLPDFTEEEEDFMRQTVTNRRRRSSGIDFETDTVKVVSRGGLQPEVPPSDVDIVEVVTADGEQVELAVKKPSSGKKVRMHSSVSVRKIEEDNEDGDDDDEAEDETKA